MFLKSRNVESYCKMCSISGLPNVVQESMINGLVKSFPCASQKWFYVLSEVSISG